MTQEQKRIRSAINRLSLRPIQRCTRSGAVGCCFCANAIRLDDQYRNASTIRSHETCYQAVADAYRKAGR